MRMGRVYCEPFIKVWLVLFLFRFRDLTASSKESLVKAEFNKCLLGWTLHMHNVSEALYQRWNFCVTSWALITVYAVGIWYSATSAPSITYSIFTWGYYTSFSAKVFKHSFGNISQWCNTPYWCSRRWCRFSNSSGWVFCPFTFALETTPLTRPLATLWVEQVRLVLGLTFVSVCCSGLGKSVHGPFYSLSVCDDLFFLLHWIGWPKHDAEDGQHTI